MKSNHYRLSTCLGGLLTLLTVDGLFCFHCIFREGFVKLFLHFYFFSDDDFFFGGGPLSDDKPSKSAKQISTGPGQGKASRVTGRLQVTCSLEINNHISPSVPHNSCRTLAYDNFTICITKIWHSDMASLHRPIGLQVSGLFKINLFMLSFSSMIKISI